MGCKILQTLMLLLKIIILIHLTILEIESKAAKLPIAKPNCRDKCGNLSIPYPFGIGKDCYFDEYFEITCNDSSVPATITWFDSYLYSIKMEPPLISVQTVFFGTPYNNTTGQNLFAGSSGEADLAGSPFSLSHTKNKFVAVGCDIYASIEDETRQVVAGCAAHCNHTGSNNSLARLFPCSAINGCCQSPISKRLTEASLWVYTINTMERSWRYSGQCSFPMIMDKDFDFSSSKLNFSNCNDDKNIPILLDWSIGNLSFKEAMRRKSCICSNNSNCTASDRGMGYLCKCLPGFQGNPYLPDGCKDIDECENPNMIHCPKKARCVNTEGSYFCTCPSGYHRQLYDFGEACRPHRARKMLAILLSLSVGLATFLLILIAIGFWLYRKFKKMKENKVREKFFKRNGGLLLQQHIRSSQTGNVLEMKLFKTEELEKATDNFNEGRILGKGGLGTVYKGMLSDGRIVAVKKSNVVDEDQVGQFVNEIFILSQINHRNIVKVLGCCLETLVPLLVYEYVPNGTLAHHLHNKDNGLTLSWKHRLDIATQVAGALAYLHFCASTSIFHRDIKSSNILVDDNYRAVISDFGISKLVATDKTHLTTLVGGTFGYIDPEYFRTGQLNDKSDVYSFGVVLAELLTGQKVVSSDKSDLGLAIRLRSAIKEKRLFEILDETVASEGLQEEVIAVANIAKRCLKMNAKKRPCMREIAAELEQIKRVRDELRSESFQDNGNTASEWYDSCSTSDAVDD